MRHFLDLSLTAALLVLCIALIGLCVAVPVLLHESNLKLDRVGTEAGRIADEMNALRKHLER